MINGRADRQVKRLIKTIYTPKHFYYIHVDKVVVLITFLNQFTNFVFVPIAISILA